MKNSYAVLLVTLLVLILTQTMHCTRTEKQTPISKKTPRVEPISAILEQNVLSACKEERDMVCACSDSQPSLQAQCHQATSRIQAIQMLRQINKRDAASNESRQMSSDKLQKFLAGCLSRRTLVMESGCQSNKK